MLTPSVEKNALTELSRSVQQQLKEALPTPAQHRFFSKAATGASFAAIALLALHSEPADAFFEISISVPSISITTDHYHGSSHRLYDLRRQSLANLQARASDPSLRNDPRMARSLVLELTNRFERQPQSDYFYALDTLASNPRLGSQGAEALFYRLSDLDGSTNTANHLMQQLLTNPSTDYAFAEKQAAKILHSPWQSRTGRLNAQSIHTLHAALANPNAIEHPRRYRQLLRDAAQLGDLLISGRARFDGSREMQMLLGSHLQEQAIDLISALDQRSAVRQRASVRDITQAVDPLAGLMSDYLLIEETGQGLGERDYRWMNFMAQSPLLDEGQYRFLLIESLGQTESGHQHLGSLRGSLLNSQNESARRWAASALADYLRDAKDNGRSVPGFQLQFIENVATSGILVGRDSHRLERALEQYNRTAATAPIEHALSAGKIDMDALYRLQQQLHDQQLSKDQKIEWSAFLEGQIRQATPGRSIMIVDGQQTLSRRESHRVADILLGQLDEALNQTRIERSMPGF